MKLKIVLLLILTVSFILRFYKLGLIPQSLYWDEVSIGFNAYSVLKTGADEWGRRFPFFFEAFNEFKFPVAIYLTSFFIKIFGYTDFAVRFASAFFGSLAPLAFYFFSKKVIGVYVSKSLGKFRSKIGIFSAFILAVSQWSIQFGRAEFEANIALFFEIAGLYLLINFLEKPTIRKWLIFSLLIFLDVYTYSVQIFFIFFACTFIILIHKLSLRLKICYVFVFLLTFLIIELPFFYHLYKDNFTRFNQVSIFSGSQYIPKIIHLREKYGGWTRLIFNKYVGVAIDYLSNLIRHLNPFFLYPGRDGNLRHSVGFGLIYPFELVFLFCGFIYLFLKDKKFFLILLVFVIIGYTPSSLTQEVPHALRSLNASIFICLFLAIGILAIKKSMLLTRNRIFLVLIIFAYAFFTNKYLTTYYFVYPKTSFSAWGTENKLMMQEAQKFASKDEIIYFTGDYWRSYIYYYYYYKTDPFLVQKNNNSTQIGRTYFGYAKWDKADRRYDYFFKPESLIMTKKKTLLYLSESERLFFTVLLKTNNFFLKRIFKNPEGKNAVYIFEN